MSRRISACVFFVALMMLGSSVATLGRVRPREDKPDGKAVFLKYKCDNCHSVSTTGITAKTKTKAPDLVNVTVRHEKDGGKGFVHKYIRQEQGHMSCPKVDKNHDGKLHTGGKFKGTQDEEDALVDWLDEQRKPEN